MFEYLEPDNQDNQEANPWTESLPLSAKTGGNDPGTPPLKTPTPEKVRHMIYGSLAGIDRTIKILHAYGYADPNDWSDPIPVPSTENRSPGAVAGATSQPAMPWMVILTKTVLIERY